MEQDFWRYKVEEFPVHSMERDMGWFLLRGEESKRNSTNNTRNCFVKEGVKAVRAGNRLSASTLKNN